MTRRWHLLDAAPADPVATIVCVHGNPTWGYAWASFLRRFGATHRVIAIDQLGMGYSERTPQRRFATRVADLDDVMGALDISGEVPLFLAAHDWGGAIALGWAVDHVDRLAGMILCNTGIAVPEGRSAPAIIRLAASAAMLELVCHGTPTFVEGTIRLSGDRLSATDRSAFRAPYKSAQSRVAIADFVGDIPLHHGHPSERPIAAVADRLGAITVPVLLAWARARPGVQRRLRRRSRGAAAEHGPAPIPEGQPPRDGRSRPRRDHGGRRRRPLHVGNHLQQAFGVAISGARAPEMSTQTGMDGAISGGWGRAWRSGRVTMAWRSSTWPRATNCVSPSWPAGSMASPPISCAEGWSRAIGWR